MRINFIQKIIDKIRKKIHHVNPNPIFYGRKFIYSRNDVTELVANCINSDNPISVLRYNSIEYDVLKEFLSFKSNKKIHYSEQIKIASELNAGFFPSDDYNLSKFASELINVTKSADLFAIWGNVFERHLCTEFLSENAKIILLHKFSDILSENSWTRLLKGKKILVVHPFKETIEEQYKKRELLHCNPDILPEFELTVIKAPQTSGGNRDSYNYETWFDALNELKQKVREADFDIALLGAGAYGLFLTDYCKKLGKKGLHMGSSIQLLFGIKGHRWDDQGFYNEYWVRPPKSEIPPAAEQIETAQGGSPYW